MCLNSLEKFKVHRYEGWQVFREKNGALTGLYYNKDIEIETNKWQKDKREIKILASNFSSLYRTGYHICLKKQQADNFAIVARRTCVETVVKKVKFKKVVAKGYQSKDFKVIVARERFVCTK